MSLSVPGATVGEVELSLFVAGAVFGEVELPLFAAGAICREMWNDIAGARNVVFFHTKCSW